MKCEKCGNINPEEQLNCTECGGPLGELEKGIETVLDPLIKPLVESATDPVEEEDAEPVITLNADDVEPVVETDTDSSMQPEANRAVYTEDKSHKKNSKIVIGVILLLLIGTLTAVYFNKEGLKAQPQEQEQAIENPASTPAPTTVVSNKETIITLNEEPIAHSVFNLYFWITQQRFASAGPDVWEMESEGKKMIDIAKENTIQDIKLAMAAKQKLTELGLEIEATEKEEATKQANDIMTNNTDLGPMLQVDVTDMEEFILHGLYLQKAMAAIAEDYTPTEEEINTQMLQVQAQFETATVKHVLIGSKDEAAKTLAEEVLQKALAGEDMAELAKTYSEDPGSKDAGGEYTFPKGQMVPEFEEASFTGEIGKVYPQLVETSYGYHIIKVESRASGDSAEIRKQSEEAAKYYYAQEELMKLTEAITVQTTDLYDKLEIVK